MQKIFSNTAEVKANNFTANKIQIVGTPKNAWKRRKAFSLQTNSITERLEYIHTAQMCVFQKNFPANKSWTKCDKIGTKCKLSTLQDQRHKL